MAGRMSSLLVRSIGLSVLAISSAQAQVRKKVVAPATTPGVTCTFKITIMPPAMFGQVPDVTMSAKGIFTKTGLGRVEMLKADTGSQQGRGGGIGITPGDYFLRLDSATWVAVNTTEKSYVKLDPGMAVGGMGSQMARAGDVSGIRVDLERLGEGDPIDGRSTMHYRLSTEYSVNAMGRPVVVRSVYETWQIRLGTKIENPLNGLSAPDTEPSNLSELKTKQFAMLKQIEGTSAKSILATSVDANGMVLDFQVTTEVGDIVEGPVDTKQLQVPEGFTQGESPLSLGRGGRGGRGGRAGRGGRGGRGGTA